jgi:putative glutamine amidotransferase
MTEGDATMALKMKKRRTRRPRVGVPWRTVQQERAGDQRSNRHYLRAVREAGGLPVQVSLLLPPGKLHRLAQTLDAVVLPGSGADVNPRLYRAPAHRKTAKPDVRREKTDFALLQHALPAGKPVLAICYGVQSLNVHLGGSLVQDIPGELRDPLGHRPEDGRAFRSHRVRIRTGCLAKLAGRREVTVNSWHHQSVRRLGRGLRVTARAPDGVVEAVEGTGRPGWVVGVQWHPERMRDDPLAKKLFKRLVSEAARVAARR